MGFTVSKTKAHRSREVAEAAGELQEWQGNAAADRLAKEAAATQAPVAKAHPLETQGIFDGFQGTDGDRGEQCGCCARTRGWGHGKR